jgi:hypothetical protein
MYILIGFLCCCCLRQRSRIACLQLCQRPAPGWSAANSSQCTKLPWEFFCFTCRSLNSAPRPFCSVTVLACTFVFKYLRGKKGIERTEVRWLNGPIPTQHLTSELVRWPQDIKCIRSISSQNLNASRDIFFVLNFKESSHGTYFDNQKPSCKMRYVTMRHSTYFMMSLYDLITSLMQVIL